MYVYIYIYMYTYIHVYYICVHLHAYLNTYLSTYVHMHMKDNILNLFVFSHILHSVTFLGARRKKKRKLHHYPCLSSVCSFP